MKPLNMLNYLVKEGFVSLWKNRMMALASMSTISVCLIILGMSYFLLLNLNNFLVNIESEFGIVCYIDDQTEEERIDAISKEIQSLDGIETLTYITKEEALSIYANEAEDSRVFEQFKENNPLPASFEIELSDLTYQDKIIDTLSGIPELELSYFENESDLFVKISDAIKTVAFVSILVLLIIAIFLMRNTIKLTIYIRRKEINIMKYVGASDLFIRLPFFVEGLMIGILGSSLSLAMVILIYNKAKDFILLELLGDSTLFTFVSVQDGLVHLIPITYLIGITIAIVGSMSALRKHLKV